MAKQLSPGLDTARSQLEQEFPWIWLYEIEIPTSPPTRYRFTNYTENVDFGTTSLGVPITYYAYKVVHGPIVQSSEGDLPSIQVAVSNVSRVVGATVELYNGLVGQPAVIRLVNSTDLLNSQSQIREDAEVIAVRVRNEDATFTLSAFNLYRMKFPTNRYVAQHCRHHYGGAECGYIIPAAPGGTVGTGFATCGQLFADCVLHGEDEVARSLAQEHPKRFGGFMGMARLSRAS